MKIVTLMENGSIDSRLKSAHGLCFYIEHENHKILFDLGPNNDFITNAGILGIDLALVDTVIISHGHFDHGRGLKKFMEINTKAKIYLSKNAFTKQYKKVKFVYLPIGIKKPKEMDRIVFIEEDTAISDTMKICANVKMTKQIIGDDSLLTKKNGEYIPDRFDHEIYFYVKTAENNVLLSGCSHKGIENIVDRLTKRENIIFSHVIGGFHMSHYDPEDLIQTTYLESLGQKLKKSKAKKYYSCHCTGDIAYTALKIQMKEKLERIKTGSVIEL
jgi:7,8-dihydropterin-6-yl-methyl-4-(beta-D-ribofuranosyl)aminobenzene 5'-phosphate synthase